MWRRPIDVEVNVHTVEGLEGIHPKLDAILALLRTQGVAVSELTDAVVAMKERVDADVQGLLDKIIDLGGQLSAALANDAADAATIAAKQAEIDALVAEATQVVADLNAIDPVADLPEG